MISRNDLDHLAALKNDEGIASVYIGIEPRMRYDPSQHEKKFRGAVKRFLRRPGSEFARAAVLREQERILDSLRSSDPKGRGLAIFASTAGQIWERFELAVRVPTFVDADVTPSMALITRVVDEYPRLAVAVVERDHAAIYIAEQGQNRQEAEVESTVPGRHSQGGWAQARFQRHIEMHVAKHLQKVVEELHDLYYKQEPFSRLIIGGTGETVAELVRMLPDPIARRLIATLRVDFKHETEDQMLERARAAMHEDERRRERELVDRVVSAAESGGRGTAGIDDTLEAVMEGRVDTLLLADGVTLEGSTCLECDYFSGRPFERCPACASASEVTSDIVERAVERALLSGASVETVFGEGREWLLARGGLAAALRF
jgi:peptide subunit release factor 1 (eRF1)